MIYVLLIATLSLTKRKKNRNIISLFQDLLHDQRVTGRGFHIYVAQPTGMTPCSTGMISAQKFTYMVNPKAGCTTISHVLSTEGETAHLPTVRKPHSIFGMLGHSRHLGFTFSFVRNPYERAYSGFISQFQLSWQRYVSSGRKNFSVFSDLTFWRLMFRKYGMELEDPDSCNPVSSFAEYVRFISLYNRHYEGHYSSQTRNLMYDHGIIHYDFIGRLERFEQDMTHVLDCIEAPKKSYDLVKIQKNRSEHKMSLADVYDDESQALIYDSFRSDFVNFGYSEDLPSS